MKEALKMALELFEQFGRDSRLKYEHQAIYKTITAIKEALAQPEQEKERCVGCEAYIDTACGRDECPKGWPKAPQPKEQEPVAWLHWLHGPVRLFLNKDEAMMELDRLNREYPVDKDARQMKPLYTTPPQRKPLTDEQLMIALLHVDADAKRLPIGFRAFARAIEAAHGIKE